MARWTWLACALLGGCGGNPTTLVIGFGADAATVDDDADVNAGPQVDASSEAGAEQDAAVHVDASVADVAIETTVDGAVCGSTPVPPDVALGNSCFAAVIDPGAEPKNGCPSCAPYAFRCGDQFPAMLPREGVSSVAIDGGMEWCSPIPYCVRLSQEDVSCPSQKPRAYSCSAYTDGSNAAPRPSTGCLVVSGAVSITCCD